MTVRLAGAITGTNVIINTTPFSRLIVNMKERVELEELGVLGTGVKG